MARSRTILTAGAVGVAALALIGAGASATFTDSVDARQSITAGTMNMTVTGPDDSRTNGSTVTLKAVGPVGSTFQSDKQLVKIKNQGDITAKAITLSAADWNNNDTLRRELYVQILPTDATRTTPPLYDGTLVNLEQNPISFVGSLASGASSSFLVMYYAGGTAPTLSNPAQSGVVIPSLTVHHEG